MRYFILEDKKVIEVDNFNTYAAWDKLANHVIKKTKIFEGVEVSTIFSGSNYDYLTKKPLHFETIIFGWDNDNYRDHHATYEEAIAGHDRAIAMIFEIA